MRAAARDSWGLTRGVTSELVSAAHMSTVVDSREHKERVQTQHNRVGVGQIAFV